MKYFFQFLIACAFLGCSEAQEADFVFTNVNLIDMTSTQVKLKQTVVIDQGKIVSISPADSAEYSNDAKVIDADGQFLMPGLAEMHAHIPGNGDMDLLEETLFLYLSNGITTIRGMLGQPYHLQLRDQVLRKEILGPRIYTSGPSMNGNTVRSVEEAQQKVREQKAAGYDFLKLHPGLTRENFDALVSTAKEVGIPYAGHVSVDVGIRRALEAQYASIDHVDGYIEGLVPNTIRANPNANGFFGINFTNIIDRSLIDGLVEMTIANDVWIVPTQAMMERWVGPEDPELIAQEPEMKYMSPNTLNNWVNTKKSVIEGPNYDAGRALEFNEIRRDIINRLYKARANILLGSDAPQVFNVPGFSIQREMDAMVRAGMSNFDVLYSGTVNPAKFFKAEGKYGSIQVGADADLILLEANPLDDISNMRKQKGVMVRGTWLSKEMIDKRLSQIAAKYNDQ